MPSYIKRGIRQFINCNQIIKNKLQAKHTGSEINKMLLSANDYNIHKTVKMQNKMIMILRILNILCFSC